MKMWRKPVVTVAGGFLVLAGTVMLVTPGPGLLVIAGGMALWATEYEWAEHLLENLKNRLSKKSGDSK